MTGGALERALHTLEQELGVEAYVDEDSNLLFCNMCIDTGRENLRKLPPEDIAEMCADPPGVLECSVCAGVIARA